MTGSAVTIAAGATQVWVINSSGQLFKWNGSSFAQQTLPSGVSAVAQVSVGKLNDNPWVLDDSGQVYLRHSIASAHREIVCNTPRTFAPEFIGDNNAKI